MALNLCRAVRGIGGRLAKRALHTTSVIRSDVPTRMNIPNDEDRKLEEASRTVPDTAGHAVGYERYEFLENIKGNLDPFDVDVYQVENQGTVDNPIIVPSMWDTRCVGCLCSEEPGHPLWMHINKGEKKRCYCGVWFEFKEVKPAFDLN